MQKNILTNVGNAKMNLIDTLLRPGNFIDYHETLRTRCQGYRQRHISSFFHHHHREVDTAGRKNIAFFCISLLRPAYSLLNQIKILKIHIGSSVTKKKIKISSTKLNENKTHKYLKYLP